MRLHKPIECEMVLKDKKIPQNVGCKILIEKMCLSCCIKSGAHVQKEMKKNETTMKTTTTTTTICDEEIWEKIFPRRISNRKNVSEEAHIKNQ